MSKLTLKKFLPIAAIVVAAYFGWDQIEVANDSENLTGQSNSALTNAIKERKRNVQVEDQGTVIKLLPDDNDGSRHQRFILKHHSGQTLLIAHNIDLAPRIPSLNKGDTVTFNGVYEWSSKGGVVHWTHHDPNGRHVPGWLKHNGQTYQ